MIEGDYCSISDGDHHLYGIPVLVDVSQSQTILEEMVHRFEARKDIVSHEPGGGVDVSQTHPLELIIRGASHVLMSVLHDTHHQTRSTPLTHSQCEPLSQPFDRTLSFERGKSGVEHQPNGINELVSVRPQSKERFDGQMLKHGITL